MEIQTTAGKAAKAIKAQVAARKDIDQYEKACYGVAIRRLESICDGTLRPTKELDDTAKTSLLAIAADKMFHELSKNSADKALVEQARKLENKELLTTVLETPKYWSNIRFADGNNLVEWAENGFEAFKKKSVVDEFKTALETVINEKEKAKENNQPTSQRTNDQRQIGNQSN